MFRFKAILVSIWLVVMGYTIRAVWNDGLRVAPYVFYGDLKHPWRGQTNVDFLCYLALVAGWIFYREESSWKGLLFGILEFLCGNVFFPLYLLKAVSEADGDPVVLLLGKTHASARGSKIH